jgi:hypothetical protein
MPGLGHFYLDFGIFSLFLWKTFNRRRTFTPSQTSLGEAASLRGLAIYVVVLGTVAASRENSDGLPARIARS